MATSQQAAFAVQVVDHPRRNIGVSTPQRSDLLRDHSDYGGFCHARLPTIRTSVPMRKMLLFSIAANALL